MSRGEKLVKLALETKHELGENMAKGKYLMMIKIVRGLIDC